MTMSDEKQNADIVDATELLSPQPAKPNHDDATRVSINDILGQTIYIYDIAFFKSNFDDSDRAVVRAFTDDERKIFFYTGSTVLLQQLKTIKPAIEQGKIVRAVIRRRKGRGKFGYYTLKG